MTVREWVTGRSGQVPEALTARVLELLAADADADVGRTAAACLAAAGRSLEGLLAAGRYERDGALELLAVDALTTFAFEHVGETAPRAADIRDLAINGAVVLSGLASDG